VDETDTFGKGEKGQRVTDQDPVQSQKTRPA
jgi:hypothetical protein